MSKATYVAVMVAIIVVVVEMHVTKAVDCNPVALSPCLPAIKDPAVNPPKQCCDNLIAQEPCLCNYIKNPSFAPYIKSPGAKRVASFCNVNIPNCS